MVQEITLPNKEEFYTREYKFAVELVDFACATYRDATELKDYTLALDPNMKALLQARGKTHRASLEWIARAAMQFYQTDEGPDEALDAVELAFMLMYEFGHVLRNGTGKYAATRLGPILSRGGLRHAESIRKVTEIFGYGLSLHYVSVALGIPVDWFKFITDTGKKPDFRMTKPLAEIVAANPLLLTLGPTGQKVYVEVKARTGWAGIHKENTKNSILLDIAKKAASFSDGIFLGIVIGLPKGSKSPRRTPTILIADPGEPDPLSIDERARFVLERYLALAHRYGLWKVVRDILIWLQALGSIVSDTVKERFARLDRQLPRTAGPQSFLPTRSIDDREYQGRYFYTLLERLGRPGNRRLTRAEAGHAVRTRDFGTKYFAGVDLELARILGSPRRDPQALLAFGTRDGGNADLSGRSAFRETRVEIDQADEQAIEQAITSALERW